MIIKTYRDLIVWQKSMILCTEIYKISKQFPREELYGITSQIRRSVISIPSNIAEGYQRGHKEYIQFLRISFGSGAELETQLLVVLNVGYLNQKQYDELNYKLVEIMKMLNKMISTLSSSYSLYPKR